MGGRNRRDPEGNKTRKDGCSHPIYSSTPVNMEEVGQALLLLPAGNNSLGEVAAATGRNGDATNNAAPIPTIATAKNDNNGNVSNTGQKVVGRRSGGRYYTRDKNCARASCTLRSSGAEVDK